MYSFDIIFQLLTYTLFREAGNGLPGVIKEGRLTIDVFLYYRIRGDNLRISG
jgi:hypothetical protein